MSDGPELRFRGAAFAFGDGGPVPDLSGYGSIVVEADRVSIEGHVVLSGVTVDITARELTAGPGAVLDVSGAPAEPDFGPDDAAASGTPTAPDGQPGAAGGAGRPGGSVTIVAGRTVGDLIVHAAGSAGGAGQRGGDGFEPTAPRAADGEFTKFKKYSSGDYPVRGKYGGKALYGAKARARSYAAWAAGQPGFDAAAGGAPGQPGDGGDGGEVNVRIAEGGSVTIGSVDAGAAGAAPTAAAPNPPTEAGVGGRNRIYMWWVKPFGFDGVEDWVGGRNADINEVARKYKIPARAPTGKSRAAAGTVSPDPVAAAGQPGEVFAQTVDADALADSFGEELLRLVIEEAMDIDDVEERRQRLEWVEQVAGDRASIGDYAREAIDMLDAGLMQFELEAAEAAVMEGDLDQAADHFRSLLEATDGATDDERRAVHEAAQAALEALAEPAA